MMLSATATATAKVHQKYRERQNGQQCQESPNCYPRHGIRKKTRPRSEAQKQMRKCFRAMDPSISEMEIDEVMNKLSTASKAGKKTAEVGENDYTTQVDGPTTIRDNSETKYIYHDTNLKMSHGSRSFALLVDCQDEMVHDVDRHAPAQHSEHCQTAAIQSVSGQGVRSLGLGDIKQVVEASKSSPHRLISLNSYKCSSELVCVSDIDTSLRHLTIRSSREFGSYTPQENDCLPLYLEATEFGDADWIIVEKGG